MFIVTETQNGQEVEVARFNTLKEAIHYSRWQYDEDDDIRLAPCIYKALEDGSKTTEY